MARLVLIAAAASAALTGCYAPSVPDCAYTCATDSDCPSSQQCDVSVHACRAAGATGTCGAIGADGGLGFTPSNYTAADLSALPATPLVVTEALSINTDTDTPSSKLLTVGSTKMRLFHFTALTVKAGGDLTVSGTASAIFALDGDATIDGQIDVVAGGSTCATESGTTGQTCSSGGAGGAFNGHGGDGGGCVSEPAALGAPPTVTGLIPLAGGCAGAPPASTSGTMTIGGGAAGGSIEISSRTTIAVGSGGEIDASGGGGLGGTVGAANFLIGGAGGGAGGGILLEAPSVSLDPGATVCATGGGGGGAASSNGSGTGGPGTSGDRGCSPFGGVGGKSAQNDDGTGGDGGGDASHMAGDGSAGNDGGGDAGGGGGGGASGLIIVRASTPVSFSASIAPMPTRQPL